MSLICKNCATIFNGKFCPACSQKASTGRLRVSNVLNEFWHNFTHTDHSVFGFVRDMLKNPGLVIREFIEGKRKKYFSPYTFFIISTAILIFVTTKIFAYEDKLYAINNEFGLYIAKHYNIIVICCLPFLALLCKVAFHARKYNYAEWIAFFVFAFGLINFIQIIVQLLFFLFIKYHFGFNKYAIMFGYIILTYIFYSFLKPKNIREWIATLLVGILFYWFVEIVGSGMALWLYGVPFKTLLDNF
jgi:hypothetical protein